MDSKILVQATEASKKLGVIIAELGRVAEPGEVFELIPSRYYLLGGYNNKYKAIFVKKADPSKNKPIKKSRKKRLEDINHE